MAILDLVINEEREEEEWKKLIMEAKDLGLSIDEIREFLSLSNHTKLISHTSNC
ncbi:anti-repressor SinI family protein [Metabacillus fastidiosus]|uniref:anti-repressor SinI family protein n=1 Tax=Metabacillus fastidiosus TaxID=1458 RepID=UPI002E1D0BF9|nr:anti-repressor SinI family protein [Metabacillus fastidiosus]